MLHAGRPGFGFRHGEVWGVHTAFSGNHRHLAEQVNTGSRILGGGELLLPGEAVLDPGKSYAGPWLYASLRRGARRRLPPASTGTCARDRTMWTPTGLSP